MKLNSKFDKIKVFTIILISLMIFLFVWLGIKNYPFEGQYKIDMILGYDHSLITKLGPPPRVELESDYQKIFESPVYFDVRILPWYSTAQVYITYKDGGEVLENMGIQVGPGFNYRVVDPVFLSYTERDYRKAMFEFDLSDSYQEKNFSRFLISTSDLDPDQRGYLQIKSLKVILKR